MTSRALFAQIRVVVALGILANAGCSSPGGPTQTGPTQTGPTQTGPTQTGPTQTGPTQVGALKLNASFVEFQLGGTSAWFYAPRLQVTETSGVGGFEVTGLKFSVPGNNMPLDCPISARVRPGQTVDLAYEMWSAFPMRFANGDHAPGAFGVVLSFIDDSGRRDSITLTLPTTPGPVPTPYATGLTFSCGL